MIIHQLSDPLKHQSSKSPLRANTRRRRALEPVYDGEVARAGQPLGLICQCVKQSSTYGNPYTVVGTNSDEVAKEVKKLERQVIEEKLEIQREEQDKLHGHESTIEEK